MKDLHRGNGGFISDSAQIRSDFDPDVSGLSPVSSPAISNDPICSASSVSLVSRELDAVINVARAASNNSSRIILPRGSIDAY